MIKIKTRQIHFDIALIIILLFFVINLIKSEDLNKVTINNLKNDQKQINKINETLYNNLIYSKNNDNNNNNNNNNNIKDLLKISFDNKLNDNNNLKKNDEIKINNNNNYNNNLNENIYKLPIPLAFIQMIFLSILLCCGLTSFKH